MKRKNANDGGTLTTGALSASWNDWRVIQWPEVVAQVRRLQLRIAKAYREGRHGKVKALQWVLTHSFYAKLLAVTPDPI